MPPWLKIILIIFGLFALIVVGVAVSGYYYFQKHGGELKAQAKKVEADGEAFGRERDGNACVDESLQRIRREPGFVSQVRTQIFLRACLKTAAESPELCASVPPPTEIIRMSQWSVAQCAKRGLGDSQPCAQLMNVVAAECHKTSK